MPELLHASESCYCFITQWVLPCNKPSTSKEISPRSSLGNRCQINKHNKPSFYQIVSMLPCKLGTIASFLPSVHASSSPTPPDPNSLSSTTMTNSLPTNFHPFMLATPNFLPIFLSLTCLPSFNSSSSQTSNRGHSTSPRTNIATLVTELVPIFESSKAFSC